MGEAAVADGFVAGAEIIEGDFGTDGMRRPACGRM